MAKVLFGHKRGEPDYTEVLLTEVEDRIADATVWAEANGYTVRIADIDLETAPDFAATVQPFTVKRVDIFGTVTDTRMTEAELNGFKASQGRLI